MHTLKVDWMCFDAITWSSHGPVEMIDEEARGFLVGDRLRVKPNDDDRFSTEVEVVSVKPHASGFDVCEVVRLTNPRRIELLEQKLAAALERIERLEGRDD